jgi:hypothetical protein
MMVTGKSGRVVSMVSTGLAAAEVIIFGESY